MKSMWLYIGGYFLIILSMIGVIIDGDANQVRPYLAAGNVLLFMGLAAKN